MGSYPLRSENGGQQRNKLHIHREHNRQGYQRNQTLSELEPLTQRLSRTLFQHLLLSLVLLFATTINIRTPITKGLFRC
jgi:hypothetical protein